MLCFPKGGVCMILQATKALIDLVRHERCSYSFARAYASAIARFGSIEDARALFAAFLEDPARGDLILSFLFTPIRLLGDSQLAHEMFLQCVSHDRLHSEMREEILLCFGFLGYLPAKPLLWRYATQESDYQHGRMACLGLAHLPCNGLQAEIASALHADFGKNFWDSEFLPVLASKTGNIDLLPALYEWGSTNASIDCNGGLVL